MITNSGKAILGKYLVGQTDSYASYLAIGCGTKPIANISMSVTNKALSSNTATLTTASNHGWSVGDYISVFDVDTRLNGTYALIAPTSGSTLTYTVTSGDTISSSSVTPNGTVALNFSNNTTLGFEMTRFPVMSKSFVTENGVSKLIFTAEIPTNFRYEISEIGIYPYDTNVSSIGQDSINLYLFDRSESWIYHTATTSSSLPSVTKSIADNVTNAISITTDDNGNAITDDAFFTTCDNGLFDNASYPDRVNRYERPRFLNDTILIRGDTSTLTVSGSNLTSSGSHIHLPTSGLSKIDKNITDDEIRLAFSVINKRGIGYSTDIPSNVKILVQFVTDEGGSAEYANLVVNLDNGTSSGQWDFSTNRYVVINKKLSDLYKSTGFLWSNVAFIKIYVCVNNGSTDSEKFFVALDALRLENLSSFTSVYGLSGYTKLYTSDSLPILKNENTTTLIEFKSVVGVL